MVWTGVQAAFALALKDIYFDLSKNCNQKGKWWGNLHIQIYGEVILTYIWFNLNFTDWWNLHGTAALAIVEENTFESPDGGAVAQTPKVRLGGHWRCDFGHVILDMFLYITENLSFLKCIADQEKTTGGCGVISERGHCVCSAQLSPLRLRQACQVSFVSSLV